MHAAVSPRSRANSRSASRLLRRVLRSDPSQEYLMFVPGTAVRHGRLLVAIHGMSRNADQHVRLLAANADRYATVVVAPIFAAEQYPDYQRLGRIGHSKRADVALNLVVADAAAITGAAAEQFYLFGFGGGAQFAHRYVMAHPHRVAGAVVASAGWYTLPDPTRRFPYGTRMTRKLHDVRFDAEEFLNVPITVLVGTGDTVEKGLRHKPRLDREQGVNRLERARSWVESMRSSAAMHHMECRVRCEEVENCNGSFSESVLRSDLADKVFRALFTTPGARASGG